MSATTTSDSSGTVGQTAGAAKESGQQLAGSASDHARDLAGTASEKASDVLGEAKSQAGDLLGNAREQIGTEAENRRGQAVTSLRAIGDELDSMKSHDGDHGVATELASRGTDYVRRTADWLDGRQPGEIMDDVRRFARDRPGTFLLGALVAGVVAGRLTRAVKAGAPTTGSGSTPQHTATTPQHGVTTPTAPAPAAFASSQTVAPGIDTAGYDAPTAYDPALGDYPRGTDAFGAPSQNRPGGAL